MATQTSGRLVIRPPAHAEVGAPQIFVRRPVTRGTLRWFWALAFGPAWKAHGGLGVEADWIVTEPDGSVILPDTLRARWAALVRKAGVTPVPLHAARHTYAEIALASGVRLDVVSRQLGHASISTTAGNYLHDSDEAATAAAELLGKTLEGGR